MDSSVALTQHDRRDIGLIYLIKKHKIRLRILSDLRIQSWIFLKKLTLHFRNDIASQSWDQIYNSTDPNEMRLQWKCSKRANTYRVSYCESPCYAARFCLLYLFIIRAL